MTHKKIKVLQVLVCLGGGGVETLLLDMQERLPEHIIFDYLVAHHDFRDKEALARGSTIYTFPLDMQRPTRWATHVGQLVREHHYDVVHFHRFAFGGNVLKAAKQAGSTGRIAHSHRIDLRDTSLPVRLLYQPYHWTINRWLLSRHATNLIGCSSDALRHLIGPFENNPKCRVVLNGIPIELFADGMHSTPKTELCQNYGIPADARVIGNFGRLAPMKNQEFLLLLLNLLVKRNQTNKPVMFIGGEGELRSRLEQVRDQYSLQDHVFMPGHCMNVPELLHNLCDCFVFPSQAAEGFGLGIIEAVAAGLYVVCSDVITKDITGAFPDRITALSLSAPLERWADAVEDAIQRRIPPEQGLELVRNSLMTFQHFTDEMIKIYETF